MAKPWLRRRSRHGRKRGLSRTEGGPMAGSVSSSTGPSVFEGAKVNMGFIAAIVAVATIGGFMFGYDSGVVNGTQAWLEKTFNLSKLGLGVNVGAILIGCAAGAFIAASMADWIGRK